MEILYNNAGLSLEEFIKSRGGHAPVFSLRVNCRNTPRIAALAQMLSQSQPGYTKVLRPDNRVEPELHYYCSEEDQQQLLVQILQKMYEEGFSGGDIVILSPKASGQCAVKVNTIPWKDRIKPYETAGKGHIGYCTVHAFKGLEAGVVIVTDVYRVTGPGADNLFYIALTRALHRLVVLAAETVKSEVRNILLQRGRG